MLIDAAPGRGSRALPILWTVWLLLVGLGSGCSPDAFLVADEDRDRNFQRARDAERLGDYAVAAEHYERAIDTNPRLPSVHLGYAQLSEVHLKRYADAVYHYQRYLRLRPEDPKADDIRRRITNCTERLATSVPLVIRSETIARDLESVRSENLALRSQVTNLLATASYWSNEWRRLTVVPLQLPPPAPSGSSTGAPPAGASSSALTATASPTARPYPRGAAPPAAGSSVSRTATGATGAIGVPGTVRYHRVQPGETMESIARRYGLTGAALQRANPRIEPRRMKAGTEIRIPAR